MATAAGAGQRVRHVVEHLLPEDLCRELALVHRTCAVPGYRSRCTSATLFASPCWAWPALLRARNLARDAAEELLDDFGGLWPETTVTVAWWPGSGLPAHSDNCRDYLSARHVSVVVWLSSYSEDFTGGEFFFEGDEGGEGDVAVEPRAGRAVIFAASERHGLRAVASGERLALNVWLTRDPSAAEDARLLDALPPQLPALLGREARLHGRGPQARWPPGRPARTLARLLLQRAGLQLRSQGPRLRGTGGSLPSLSPRRRRRLAAASYAEALVAAGRGAPPSAAAARKGLLALVRAREASVRRALSEWRAKGLIDPPPDFAPLWPRRARRPSGRRKRTQEACRELPPTVERSEAVPGLAVARAVLRPALRRRLEAAVDATLLPAGPSGGGSSSSGDVGRCSARPDQAMRFGDDLPSWARALGARCARLPGLLSPSVAARRPRFDQLIVNSYGHGQGIMRHVDLLKFDDGIVGVCMGDASATLRLRRLRPGTEVRPGGECALRDEELEGEPVDVEVRPGDVYALCGAARYRWTHEISADSLRGGTRRLSLTLRRLMPGALYGPG